MTHFGVLIALLRDRKIFLDDIRHNIKTDRKIISLLVSSSAFLSIYGAIIGSSSSWLQAISSAVKLPALYLITLVICLPTLYFFDILFGSRLNFKQYAALVLTNIAVISVLLFSFAPITLFFLISIHDYNFFLLVNVAIFALTGLVGIKLFYQAVQMVARIEENPLYADLLPPKQSFKEQAVKEQVAKELESPDSNSGDYLIEKPQSSQMLATSELPTTRIRLLKFWLVLYGLVGSQLGWTLRPFFGAPNETFQLFRPIESNFYSQVLQSFFTLLGF